MFQLFAIIVFGCISSQGWMFDEKEKREVCLYNRDASACHYGTGVAVLAFLASIGFLIGEFLFEQMSSVKTRKHYVLLDLGYSCKCSHEYLVCHKSTTEMKLRKYIYIFKTATKRKIENITHFNTVPVLFNQSRRV